VYPTHMITAEQKELVLGQLEATPLFGRALRHLAMRLLCELPGYYWCGIYRLEGDELVLDEYVGAVTEHTHIPIGKGVCGTAVAKNANLISDDVRELDNYLACSLDTRSEIVGLIRRDGRVIGQIDVDGHEVGTFDQSDEELLELMATRLAQCWEEDVEACRLAREMA
jgi:L-methionine (R)-S-oxide reductase